MSAYLLVDTAQGDTMAVRFPSIDAARAWEDEHEGEITVRGCVLPVSPRVALRLAVSS